MLFAIFLGAALGWGAGPDQAAAPSPSPQNAPAIGETVPAFDATGIDGNVRHIGFPKGSTKVLLFFLSGCPHCHKMLPLWNDAYSRKAPGLEVIGVILDQEPLGYWSVTPVAFPVVRSPGRAFLNTYKILRVPLTVRIAGDGEGGHVEDVGQAEVDPIRLGELFRPPAPAGRRAAPKK